MLDKTRILELIRTGTREELITEVILPLLLRVEELEQELRKLKGQNSRNSSLPPSRDQQKTKQRTNSLRKKSKKKSGGQKGHKGHTLKMHDNPEEIVDYIPTTCVHCAEDLSQCSPSLVERKQVWDIPPVKLSVTEHRRYKSKCNCCNHWTSAKYALDMQKGGITRYGDEIKNQITYLAVRQYLPYKRIQELIEVLYNHKISEGTIDNILKTKAFSATDVYQQIIAHIEKSRVVGVDESGCSVQGDKNWAWTWVTSLYTLIHISDNRGYKTTQSIFPQGFQNAVLTSDCWRTHLKTNAKGHQICLAHVRRECQALIQFDKSQWARKLDKVLLHIFHLCSMKRIPINKKLEVENQIDLLLSSSLKTSKRPIQKLKNRLVKYRNNLTVCLYNRKVPPDNNWAERAIRMIKLKTKISGTFRSHKGALRFAVLRSVVDSAIKQNIHPFEALNKPHNILIQPE